MLFGEERKKDGGGGLEDRERAQLMERLDSKKLQYIYAHRNIKSL